MYNIYQTNRNWIPSIVNPEAVIIAIKPQNLPREIYPLGMAHAYLAGTVAAPVTYGRPHVVAPTPYLAQFTAESQPLLCKTNPNLKTKKTTQPLLLKRFTKIFRSTPPEKTNPNKPNSPVPPGRHTRYAIRHPTYEIQTQFLRLQCPILLTNPNGCGIIFHTKSLVLNFTRWFWASGLALSRAAKASQIIEGEK